MLLHYHRVLDPGVIGVLPRWESQKWPYPASHLVKTQIRGAFADQLPAAAFDRAFHGVEYRMSLLRDSVEEPYTPQDGEYIGDWQWERNEDDESIPRAERDFLRSPDLQPWLTILEVSELTGIEPVLAAHREHLSKRRRWH